MERAKKPSAPLSSLAIFFWQTDDKYRKVEGKCQCLSIDRRQIRWRRFRFFWQRSNQINIYLLKTLHDQGKRHSRILYPLIQNVYTYVLFYFGCVWSASWFRGKNFIGFLTHNSPVGQFPSKVKSVHSKHPKDTDAEVISNILQKILGEFPFENLLGEIDLSPSEFRRCFWPVRSFKTHCSEYLLYLETWDFPEFPRNFVLSCTVKLFLRTSKEWGWEYFNWTLTLCRFKFFMSSSSSSHPRSEISQTPFPRIFHNFCWNYSSRLVTLNRSV